MRLLVALAVACAGHVDQPDGGCLEITIVLQPVDAGQSTAACSLCPGATSESDACDDAGLCSTTCRCGKGKVMFPDHAAALTELDCLRRRDTWFTSTDCR